MLLSSAHQCFFPFGHKCVISKSRRVAEDPRTTQKDLKDLEVAGKCVTEKTKWWPYIGNGVGIHSVLVSL